MGFVSLFNTYFKIIELPRNRQQSHCISNSLTCHMSKILQIVVTILPRVPCLVKSPEGPQNAVCVGWATGLGARRPGF